MNKANLLVVDDSLELLEAFHYFLELAGFKVKSISSIDQILDEIKFFPPDLILLDVLMAGKGGRAACRILKNSPETAYIPIILMSANPTYLEDYKEYFADAVLNKPFNISDVINKILIDFMFIFF